MKKIAIMQPYFLPYIGYFQLLNVVNEFILYDIIQYTKKGWINRNRYLLHGQDTYFTLPLKKDSDYLPIAERYITETFNKKKLFSQINHAYARAPYKMETLTLFESILFYNENNLFKYIHHSILTLCQYLGIETPIILSSTLEYENALKAQEKVIALCKARNATEYINLSGGMNLYAQEDFKEAGMALKFLKAKNFEYPQLENNFIPSLSILDVLMFNGKTKTINLLCEYEIVC